MGVASGLQRTVCWMFEKVQPYVDGVRQHREPAHLLTREVLVLDHLSIPDQVEALRPRARLAQRVWLDYRGPGVGTSQHLNIPRQPIALARYLENIHGPRNMKLQMEPVT